MQIDWVGFRCMLILYLNRYTTQVINSDLHNLSSFIMHALKYALELINSLIICN